MPSRRNTSCRILGGVRVFARHETGDEIEHGDFAAEATECLAHFRADGAGTDDGQAGRQYREGKERLVGQVAALGQAGQGNL